MWTALWPLDTIQLFFKVFFSAFLFWHERTGRHKEDTQQPDWRGAASDIALVTAGTPWCKLLYVNQPIITLNRLAFKVQRKVMVQDNTYCIPLCTILNERVSPCPGSRASPGKLIIESCLVFCFFQRKAFTLYWHIQKVLREFVNQEPLLVKKKCLHIKMQVNMTWTWTLGLNGSLPPRISK